MKKKLIITMICLLGLLLFQPLSAKMKSNIEDVVFQPLSGVRVVIDAGHGGKDNGAMKGGIHEQDINLLIANKTKKTLEKAGATVIMTREGNYDLSSEQSKNHKREDMKKRATIINEDQVDVFLSIHLNSYPSTSVKGSQVYYREDDEASKILANIVQDNLKKISETKMVPKSGDFYLLTRTNKLGVLVECGFLSNASDRKKLVDDDYQDKIAESLKSSIKEYFNMLE